MMVLSWPCWLMSKLHQFHPTLELKAAKAVVAMWADLAEIVVSGQAEAPAEKAGRNEIGKNGSGPAMEKCLKKKQFCQGPHPLRDPKLIKKTTSAELLDSIYLYI